MATFTNQTKNTATFTNASKNTASYSNTTKNTASYSNLTKAVALSYPVYWDDANAKWDDFFFFWDGGGDTSFQTKHTSSWTNTTKN